MKTLRSYQEDAVEKIYDFFNSDSYKAKMYISTGLGKSTIIQKALLAILTDTSDKLIAVLATRRIICDEMISSLLKETNDNIKIASDISEINEQKILITTYFEVMKNQLALDVFDLVICDEAQFVKDEGFFELSRENHTKFLGLLQNIESSEGWFNDSECLFSYTIKDAIKDGYNSYIGEQEFTQHFLKKLLDYQGYKNISQEVEIFDEYKNRKLLDIVAQNEKETVVIEVKLYRNLYNSKSIINNALKQILDYKDMILRNDKNNDFTFIIVLSCLVDEKLKNEIFKQYDVKIWDINNLIYLCEDNKELLQSLLRCIPYPSMELEAKKPLGLEDKKKDVIIDEAEDSFSEIYQKKLENCKSGKLNKNDKEYETICTEIIKYLFETEFFRISEQHKTGDEMFRMDLLCSLKGTTEFWKLLISFYQTKFVVFEYKNYSDYITQNLIYVTEKYLFPVALRNVAFIISRKGFDPNAEKAALGCLRESGKLIISLDDNDLIKMLVMKKNGEEPSDYLLDKVENLLMSVSK